MRAAEVLAVDDAAEVAAVAHRHHRQRDDRQVPQADDAFAGAEAGGFHFLAQRLSSGASQSAAGLQVLGRDIDRAEADVFARGKFNFLEGDGLPGHIDVAVGERVRARPGWCARSPVMRTLLSSTACV